MKKPILLIIPVIAIIFLVPAYGATNWEAMAENFKRLYQEGLVQITELTNQNNILTKDNDRLQRNYAGLEASVDEYKKINDRQHGEILVLENIITNETYKEQGKIDQLNKKVNRLENKIDKQSDQIDKLENKRANKNAQIKELQNENENLKTQLENAPTSTKTLADLIKEYQDSVVPAPAPPQYLMAIYGGDWSVCEATYQPCFHPNDDWNAIIIEGGDISFMFLGKFMTDTTIVITDSEEIVTEYDIDFSKTIQFDESGAYVWQVKEHPHLAGIITVVPNS